MTSQLDITYRQDLIDTISADFDLRPHNTRALEAVVRRLSYGYDPSVQQVCHMATGAGKTYLMAALIEYLRQQGVYNVLVVTPGLVVQSKTVRNFTPGDAKFVAGAGVPPVVYTPHTLSATLFGRVFGGEEASTVYVFNIQQLIAPKSTEGETKSGGNRAVQRGLRRDNEVYGNIFARMQEMDDLVVIADESHLYSASAKAFNSALAELAPAAAIGLTASADTSDEVVFRYPLYQAISDRCVKTPVLVSRESGYPAGSDELQLSDALKLLAVKAEHYTEYATRTGRDPVSPVLLVTCSDTTHAEQVTELLSGPGYFDDPEAVLRVDSATITDEIRQLLADLDTTESPIRAVVSVNMLKEGWDVKSVAVLCALRASTSVVLTAQTMGRGLRLPYGRYTGIGHVDQLDIIGHESYRTMLNDDKVLSEFGLDTAARPGSAPVPVDPTEENPAPEPGVDDDPTSEDASETSSEITPETSSEDTTEKASSGPSVGVRSMESTLGTGSVEPSVVIGRTEDTEDFTFLFPATVRTRAVAPSTLYGMDPEKITEAAKKVTGSSPVLDRDEIRFSPEKGKKVSTSAVHQVEGSPVLLDERTVTKALLEAVFTTGGAVRSADDFRRAKGQIVPDFMEAVPVHWTRTSLMSAEKEISRLVADHLSTIREKTAEEVQVTPVKLPPPDPSVHPPGTEIRPRVESRKDFSTAHLYGGWQQSLVEAVRFDAYSTEYRIAELADKSPSVGWWYRLSTSDGARIAYTTRNFYHPDFVVYDRAEGVHWIVEGKADSSRDDETVAAKRAAVKHLLTELRSSDEVTDTWAYLLAYESDLAAVRSWDDLKSRADVLRG